MESKFFRTFPIAEKVTAIEGLGGELAYLIEGSKRALLIDGLTGAGNLKPFVRELTDKPVSLALTHGHVDHNGAAYEYGCCYIHPADIPMLFPISGVEEDCPEWPLFHHSSIQDKLNFALNGRRMQNSDAPAITAEDIVKPCPIITYPLYEGDLFDLGDVKIEVAEIPGHTAGSLVFLDRERRIAFFGDACNMNTLLGLGGSTSVEEYKEALDHFKAKYGDCIDYVYGGHGTMAVPIKLIDDGIHLCQLILEGKDDHVPAVHRSSQNQFLGYPRGPQYAPENGSLCNIMYSTEKIRKRTLEHIITDKPIAER